MKWVLIIAGILTYLPGTPALAYQERAPEWEQARMNGCLSCHDVDRKMVGPTYRDVAKKYKNVADAEAKLINKIKKGGSGVWGTARMPANIGKMTDEDYRTTVRWILSLE